MRWLTLGWWRYVLDDSRADDEYGPFNDILIWRSRPVEWRGEYIRNHVGRVGNYIARCRCRATNHPAGVHFYNAGGYEPDMTCKGCGEDLA